MRRSVAVWCWREWPEKLRRRVLGRPAPVSAGRAGGCTPVTGPRPGAPALSVNALEVLDARYLRRDGGRVVETPGELFERVAAAIADAERAWGNATQARRWEAEFFRSMTSLDFLPNSPTLMNAGTSLGQLSACFVLPVPDSMEGIFEAVKDMALIQQSGGGTGFSFSRLRPRGDRVASTGGEASGPVSFMRIFDCATENIKQGGRRRGANMGVLRIDHPDVLDFIQAKQDGTSFQNFNLSVGVTDAFMQAVRARERFELRHPRTGLPAGSVLAAEVFAAIVQAAWTTGDPGLLFLDTINRANPTPQAGAIEATNPCGEVPLLPYESCNLASVHLAHMLREDGVDVNWDRLRAAVRLAVRFLDDVIEVNRYPVPNVDRATRANRKIGVGVMGFAEFLIRLGVPYDSDEAVRLAEDVAAAIADEARRTSGELAGERGPFPNWKGSTLEAAGPLRNATRIAIAPTGTISIIAGTTPSIEPLFALAYRRTHVLGGRTLEEVNSLFLDIAARRGLNMTSVVPRVLEHGRFEAADGVPEDLVRLFATALDIPAARHLEIQAAFQRHVDNSVSKTINLPQEATPQDIAWIYDRAWELGLKGITIFRYGSTAAQVIELGTGEASYEYDHGAPCDPGECRL
jgi:ribonucleoside-diphosphate reductase alpha chain